MTAGPFTGPAKKMAQLPHFGASGVSPMHLLFARGPPALLPVVLYKRFFNFFCVSFAGYVIPMTIGTDETLSDKYRTQAENVMHFKNLALRNYLKLTTSFFPKTVASFLNN